MSDAEAAARRSPKCAQVLEGARKVFMEHGYEGASVDEIARAAGTSKATLYSYFPDKRQLFAAVMQSQCSRQGEVMGGEEAGRAGRGGAAPDGDQLRQLPVLAGRAGDVPRLHRRGRPLPRARRRVPRLRARRGRGPS